MKGWPVDTDERKASFWLVPFALDPTRLKCPVSRFIEMVQAEGAGAYKVMWPLPAALPKAAALAPNTIGFWVHPTYSEREIRADIAAFEKVAAKTVRGERT